LKKANAYIEILQPYFSIIAGQSYHKSHLNKKYPISGADQIYPRENFIQ
jgi:hypothetical protein